ncbi:hypothetical protein N9917_02415 [Deltaproteobacteria bacterium]|nr:hypothetical protein [Deltaproteobacteria bacterium]
MTDTKHHELHQKALIEFDRLESRCCDERRLCREDRRFYSIAGAQWEGQIGEQFENKPRIEVNKIHLAIIRIFNQYRNNRISVNFVTKTGENGDQLADTCTGLYRADEMGSEAQEAYDNAFEEAVGGGMGAWRLRNVMEDDEDPDNDNQVIKFDPIYDADTCVYFDNNAKLQDKSDAKFCFVLTAMDREAYKDEYKDDPVSWPKDSQYYYTYDFDWCSADLVYIAEYYVVEHVTETIKIYEGIDGSEERYSEEDFEADPTIESALMFRGFSEIRQKKIRRKRVHKYLMSGGRILEDLGFIAGNAIPIIPVYGKRWVIDGVERFMGHVRLAKDPQRLNNSMLSWLAEIAGTSPVEKPIFTPDQISGHQNMWSMDNISNFPYLLVNPITDQNGAIVPTGPLGYTHPPNIPPALVGLMASSQSDMSEILGNQEQGDEIVSNISGKAVELLQTRLDGQTYIYVDNMAKAVKRCGEVWQGMAAEIYREPGRKMKVIGTGGKAESVELMQSTVDDDGVVVVENDLSKARFDVVAEAGPSSDSKRSKIVRELTGMLQYASDPETQAAIFMDMLSNMEGEGLSDLREWARARAIRMGIVKPTKEEKELMAAEQQNQQPDANAQFLQASALEAEAKAKKTEADTIQSLAKTEQIKADTVATMAGIEQEDKKLALDVASQLSNTLGTGNNGGF